MMKRLIAAAALALATTSAGLAAAPAVTTATVNLRAGPSTAYPVVLVVREGAAITAHGCLAGYTWCDVGIGNTRGWIAARHVEVVYRGAPTVLTPTVAAGVGVAVVAFSKGYWDAHYLTSPWYRSWGAPPRVYGPPPPPRAYYGAPPRVSSHSRDVDCAGGSCTATRSTTGVWGGSTAQTRTCADGSCTATRTSVGPWGGTASRTRTCSRGDASCTSTRTGPRGGTVDRSWEFRR